MESVKQNSSVVKWIAAGAFAALLVAGGLLVQRVSQLEAALDGQREASEKQLEAIKETAASSASAMHRTVEELNQQVAESNKSAAASAQRAASIAQRNAEKMVAQLREQQEESDQKINAEIGQVKTVTEEHTQKVTGLESSVGEVKQTVGTVQQEVATTKSTLDQTLADLKSVRGDMGVQSGLSGDQQNPKPAPFFGSAQKILPADQFTATPKGETGGATTSSGAGGASHDRGTRAHITADITTNSLLIFADQETASMIYKVIDQIDRPRLQVAIQATIAEVSLNNALQYGVQYYLKNNIGSLNLANGQSASGTRNTTPLLKTLPGFNALLGSETDPNAILTALSSKTNVKVLSTPSLVVLDNQTASLQVGDQVPVSTTQATIVNGGNNGGFPVANNIDYRNTGVILRVLPRVAANGSVTLNVDQEISNVTNPGTAANLTPTIAQRRVIDMKIVIDHQRTRTFQPCLSAIVPC